MEKNKIKKYIRSVGFWENIALLDASYNIRKNPNEYPKMTKER